MSPTVAMRWGATLGLAGCGSVQILLLEDPACDLASTYVKDDANLIETSVDIDDVDFVRTVGCEGFESDYEAGWAEIDVLIEAEDWDGATVGTTYVLEPVMWPLVAVCTFAPTADFWGVQACTVVPAGPPEVVGGRR